MDVIFCWSYPRIVVADLFYIIPYEDHKRISTSKLYYKLLINHYLRKIKMIDRCNVCLFSLPSFKIDEFHSLIMFMVTAGTSFSMNKLRI